MDNNRSKIKDYLKKIDDLEKKSSKYKEGDFSKEEYKNFLTNQIEFVKINTIKSIKYDISRDLKEIKILKEIRFKLKNNLSLNEFEKNYVLLNL